MTAGELVLAFMKKKGVSQSALAATMDDTPQNLGKKLKRSVFPVDYLDKLCDALRHNFYADMAIQWERKHFSVDSILSEPMEKYEATNPLEQYIEKLVDRKVAQRLKQK